MAEVKRAETIVGSVERWLSNPLAKALLRFVSEERAPGENRLDLALQKYAGEPVSCGFNERIVYWIVKVALDRGKSIFGYEGDLKKYLRDPVIRRGMVNVLSGIGRYGARRPFTSISPFLVVWDYTRACNLNCKHCYANATRRASPDELSTEEAKQVVDQFEQAGVVAIAFSGGEPLMRKDIYEVAGYAKSKGFFVSMATNGTLITPEVARKMNEIFDYVEISLDGFERTHDEFRGIPGVWKRTCEGIKNAVRAGLDTCAAITATRYNLKEIPELVEFVHKELGAKRVIVFNYVPTGRGKEIVEQDISPEERHELLKFLYERMMRGDGLTCYSTAPQYSAVSWEYAYGSDAGVVATHFTTEGALEALRGQTKSLAEFLGGCGAGRLYCGLEPNGDIIPCVFMPIKLGNIRKDKLADIWNNSELLWKLRDRDSIDGCSQCEHRYICGGCRARAYGYFGSVQAPDPGCVYNLQYWEKLKASAGSGQSK